MRISNRIGTCKSLRAFLIVVDLQSVNRRDKFCSRISAKTSWIFLIPNVVSAICFCDVMCEAQIYLRLVFQQS
ncbi:hypothetical protein RchiOBHm_Chr4g0385601 [Rosa chinensis]|uniref:Uncharacterized protein n=1 Tax=Rosa chinensis TaxID=74649 RepID=A0A2P6QNZ6_ROSCH|nr:hypothetical protein RchiOBHm_Chr4g0385601 [Rosa chinensis]